MAYANAAVAASAVPMAAREEGAAIDASMFDTSVEVRANAAYAI